MFDHVVRVRKFAIAATALLAAGPAFASQNQPVVVYAEPSADVRTVHISYADLDLSTAKGERQLSSRVTGAVEDVCLFGVDGPRLQSSAYYQCAGQAWSDAQPQIDRAIARARDIASNGQSSIAAAAITFSVR